IIADAPIDAIAVESQVEVIRSENIALAVIKQLRLDQDPEFIGKGGGVIGAAIGSLSRLFGDDVEPSEFDRTRRALRNFTREMTIRRIGLTYVIELRFRSYSADRAAQIVNAVADAYIVDQLEAKYQATRRAGLWLQDRLRELREQASTAEGAVVQFKAQHNIVESGDGKLMNQQQVTELNTQLVAARAKTSEARARLDRIAQIISSEVPDATVADTLKSDVVTKLRSQYLDLATREADWSARYGYNHLAAVDLRNRMREIARAISEELRRLAETYKSDYEIARQREDIVRQELDQAVNVTKLTNKAQVELRDLESSSQSYRTLYDTFLQRYMESVQQQSFPITEARLISRAAPPTKSSDPNVLLILGLAVIGGFALGGGAGLMRELSDAKFRTAGQVEELLGVDCLAVIPKLKGAPAAPRKRSKVAALAGGARALVGATNWRLTDNPSPRIKVIRATAEAPFSRFTEEIRALKLAVDLNSVLKERKVVGFTSSVPGEGKSTLSGAFAYLVALTGARVVLVDCDLRNPSLTRELAPQAKLGLLDVISGEVDLETALLHDEESGLHFLPAVVSTRLAHSNEVLASDATRALFERLHRQFDYVVADFSPLAPIVDVRATSTLVDSYIYVVEW
ncbi:MAG: AAA family ATPase, partial [Rhizobiales bacterium]|nr:AAA family ATPase [Hyphomicrobiales bacterium]